jgi:tetratricopeptide (TPR) repeat protein
MPERVEVRCFSCGQTLDIEDSSCSQCGTVQIRLCECGETVSAHTDRCPACGAEMDLLKYIPPRRLKVIVLALVLLGGIAFAVWRFLPDDPLAERRRAFADAVVDYESARYAEAQLKFRRYIEEQGQDPRALYMLAISLHQLGREPEALDYANRALQIDPSLTRAAVYLASYEYRRQNYAEALRLANQALEEEPGNIGGHMIVGKVLTRPGFFDHAEAVRHLELAAKGEVDDTEVYVLLGELKLTQEEAGLIDADSGRESAMWVQRAKEVATELIETDPEQAADIYFFLARCDYSLGDYSRAYLELQKCLSMGENQPERRLLLARLHEKRQNPVEAVRIIGEIVRQAPPGEVLLQAGDFAREIGRDDLADRTLAEARRLYPENMTVVLAYARALIHAKEMEKAELELRAITAGNPEEGRCVVALSQLLFLVPGKEEEGERLLREFAERAGPASVEMLHWIDRLLDVTPGSPEARARIEKAGELLDRSTEAVSLNDRAPLHRAFLRGKLLLRSRQFYDAREVLRTVTSKSPSNVSCHLLLAEAERELGEDHLEAMELSTVIRLEGPTTPLLIRRAEAYLRSNALSRAIVDCRQVLSEEPENADAVILLSTALLSSVPPDHEGAVACLRNALNRESAPVNVRIAYIRALMARGSLDEAARQLPLARQQPLTDAAALDLVTAEAELEDLRQNQPLSPGAIDAWTQFLEAHPGHTDAKIRFARILMEQGHLDDARTWLDLAIEEDPSSLTARRFLFELAFASPDQTPDDLTRAQSVAEEVRELAPESATDFYLRGKLALFDGEAETATGLLTRALVMAPRDSRIAYYTGLSLLEIGNLDRARLALERAVSIEPRLRSAREALAQVAFKQSVALFKEGDLLPASTGLQFAIKNSPDYIPARAMLAEVFFQAGVQGDALALDQARQECTWLLERYPDPSPDEKTGIVAPAYLLLGNILSAQGDAAGLLEACERYLEILPNDPLARFRRAAALLSYGRVDQALPILLKLHDETPGNDRVLLALADAYETSEQPEQVLIEARTAANKRPEDASFKYLLGRIQLRLQMFAEAQASLGAALDLDPDLLPAADALVETLIAAGRAKEAPAAMRDLLKRTTHRGEIRYFLGRSLLAADPRSPLGVKELRAALAEGIDSRSYRLWCTVMLLRVFTRDGQFPDARTIGEEFSSWIRNQRDLGPGWPLAPAVAEAHFLTGLTLHALGERLPAEFHYRRSMELAPTWAHPLNNLAELLRLEETGREEAYALARRATDLAPDFAEAWDTLGAILANRGKLRNAVTAFTRAIELLDTRTADQRDSSAAPEAGQLIALIFVRQAMAQIDLGSSEAARDSLRRATEYNPKVAESREYRTARNRLR